MILAAGRGERLGDLTRDCPKPLLPLKGKPMLWWHIRKLESCGITKIIINTSYLGEKILGFIQEEFAGSQFISCTQETERLETGGGVYNALELLGESPFLLINSDVWTDLDYSDLIEAVHDMNSSKAHLILVPNPKHHQHGDFALTNGVVANSGVNTYTFAGLSVLHPRLFDGCQHSRFPLAPLLRSATERGEVKGSLHAGFWIDMGTPERYQHLQDYFEQLN
jgi:MurNAc alpha-1-phosphate uridylyltransferase